MLAICHPERHMTIHYAQDDNTMKIGIHITQDNMPPVLILSKAWRVKIRSYSKTRDQTIPQ